MQNKNPYNMHYKRKDNTLEVYRPQKFKLYFQDAKDARHKDGKIQLQTRYDHTVTIDQFGITHW